MDADGTVNARGDPNTQREVVSLLSLLPLGFLFSDLTIKKVFLLGIVELNKRLREIEEAAVALRKMQAKVEKKMAAAAREDPASVSVTQSEKEEADSCSIYVGNLDYVCTPEEVQQHFESCGTANRVTILTDKFGQPKGFAFVEFVEVDAVQNALLLNESELHGYQLKVSAKRTNVPGMKQYRAQKSNPYMAMGYSPPPFYSPYGFG